MRQIFTAIYLLVSVVATAQDTTGKIYGQVTDSYCEPILGAVVWAEQGGIQKNGAATDYDGKFAIRGLSPGRYDIVCRHTGFAIKRMTRIVVSPTTPTGYLDIQMEEKTTDNEVIKGCGGPPPINLLTRTPRNTLYAKAIDTPVSQGIITGKITEESGEEIIGAIVSVSSAGTQISTAVTNYDGLYKLTNLPAGVYDLTVQYSGRQKKMVKGIKLNTASKIYKQDVCMVTNAIGCYDHITYIPPIVDQRNTTVGLKLTSEQLERLQ